MSHRTEKEQADNVTDTENGGAGVEFTDLNTDNPNAFGMIFRGRVTAEAMAGMIERIERVQASGGKARIYVDMTQYEGWDLGVAKEKLAHIGTLWGGIERLAYVVDREWMAKWIGVIDAVTPMHVRAFEHDEKEEARTWLLR